MNLKIGIAFTASCAVFCAGSAAWGLPVEVKEKEAAIVVSNGIVESKSQTSDDSGVGPLFKRKESPAESPEKWLTVSQSDTNAPVPDMWGSNRMDSGDTVRRYTERLNQAEIEGLSSRSATNESVSMESARPVFGADTVKSDLKSRASQEKEQEEIRKQVIASAKPVTPPDDHGFTGWGTAIICAVLGFTVLLVAFGKSRL